MEITGGHTVQWGRWIGEGWQMFVDDWKAWIARMLVFLLILLIPVIPMLAIVWSADLVRGDDPETPLPAFVFILLPVLILLNILASAFVFAGSYRAAFRQLRGQRTTIGELFSEGDTVLRVIGAYLLMSVFVLIGMIFCILPGYVMFGTLLYAVPLVIERNLGVTDALRASWNATKDHWFQFTLFGLVIYLIAQLGSLACFAGTLITFPLFFTITVSAYKDMFGVTGARDFVPAAPPIPRTSSAPPHPPSPPRPSEWRSTCPHCGATLMSQSARFCNVCGRELIT